MTPEKLDAMASQSGHELTWQPLDELADLVVDGVRANRYVIMKGVTDSANTLHERAEAFARSELPTSLHFG